jgi:hypothetical protein
VSVRAAHIWPLPKGYEAPACEDIGRYSNVYCNHCNTHVQVLTLENYDNVQFQLADDTNFGVLIFILAWVVFGYYVLLVLFMAIILEAFESKYDKGAIQDAYLACEFTTLHVCCSTLYAALHCKNMDALLHCILPASCSADTNIPLRLRCFTVQSGCIGIAQSSAHIDTAHSHSPEVIRSVKHSCTMQTRARRAGSDS